MRAAVALATAATLHASVNARLLRRPGRPGAARVAALVPARNEAATIAECVTALIEQDVAEVLVLDDQSTDATAQLAASAGARVISGTAPPAGWLGKPHACTQLAAAARAECDVLVFVDADVRLAPGAIAAALGTLQQLEIDLVSPFPRQLAGTVAERLVQPLIDWTLLTFLPVRLAERLPVASLAAANGQFIVVRRTAYERAGGHVRDAVLDDLALVWAIKRTGGRAAAMDGSTLAECRMYDGWPALRDGYGKSLWTAFGPPPVAALVFAGLGYVYVWPAIAALRGSRLGALAYLAGVVGRVLTGRRTGSRVWPDALVHPVSVTVAGYLTARSHVLHRRGTLQWKGRAVV